MLIGYGMPSVTNVALTNGTWLTADTWRALVDGRPARAARIQRSGTVTLNVTLARAIVPGVVALLGLNVPAGTAVTAAGASGVTHALPDGTVCAYLLPAGAAPVSSITITVAGAGMLQIGEIAVMRLTEAKITNDWGVQRVDPKSSQRDRGSQVGTIRGSSYRRLRASLSLTADAAVRAGGLAGGTDWDALDAALVNDQRCIVIPRRFVAGAVNAELLNRTALYGIATDIGETTHLRGPWHGKNLTFEELPAL